MRTKDQILVCVYCGEKGELTRDHVPPKLLLAQPFPRNLVTVPACQSCNESFQRDDEYTRTVIALDIRASKNQDARSNMQAVLRSLQRPNAKRFAEYLASRTGATMVLSADGAPMGQIVDVDQRRVNATGARIIRGLYYSEIGKPLSPHAAIKVGAKAGLSPHEPDAITIARAYSVLTDRRSGEIGSAFSYAAAFGSGVSVWIMLLYDYFVWVGTVETPTISPNSSHFTA